MLSSGLALDFTSKMPVQSVKRQTICQALSLEKEHKKKRWLLLAGNRGHLLGVNPDAIYNLIERKQLPAHKVGRLWKLMANEVDAWVRAGKVAEPGGETCPPAAGVQITCRQLGGRCQLN